MIDMSVEVKGLDEIKRALQELPQKVAQKVLRKGVQKGSGVMREALGRAAPVRHGGREWKAMNKAGTRFRGPGFLKASIKTKYLRRSSRPGTVRYGVGPFGDAFYGYIVARGHVIKRKGMVYGRVPPHNWIIPAWNAQTNSILSAMKDELNRGIVKEGQALGFTARP